MGEIGLVKQSYNNTLTVSLTRQEACANCRACSVGMNKEEMLIQADNICSAKTGDWVEVELKDGEFMHAILIMYGIPLLALLAGGAGGFFLGHLIGINSEVLGFTSGVFLMAVTYLIIAGYEKKRNKHMRARAVKITEKPME